MPRTVRERIKTWRCSTPERVKAAQENADLLFQVLADLVEWASLTGGWENPNWRNAERLLNAIRDQADGPRGTIRAAAAGK